jgi:hypothetical protein
MLAAMCTCSCQVVVAVPAEQAEHNREADRRAEVYQQHFAQVHASIDEDFKVPLKLLGTVPKVVVTSGIQALAMMVFNLVGIVFPDSSAERDMATRAIHSSFPELAGESLEMCILALTKACNGKCNQGFGHRALGKGQLFGCFSMLGLSSSLVGAGTAGPWCVVNKLLLNFVAFPRCPRTCPHVHKGGVSRYPADDTFAHMLS